MEKISAIIITLNEQRNIGRCIDSLRGVADEIVVVDSGSTDDTEAICRQAEVRFLHHPWEGYDRQKNYANSLATHPWILSIDADEALSPSLRNTLIDLKTHGLQPHTVYAFKRLTNYCGQWIHHCGWYPDTHVRLWRSGVASWDGEVHEELCFDGAVSQQTLRGDLWHYSYYSVADHAERTTRYATMAAEKAYRLGKRHRGPIAHKVAWAFLRAYLFRLGFLDGPMGYCVSKISSLYTLIKYARLRELTLQS